MTAMQSLTEEEGTLSLVAALLSTTTRLHNRYTRLLPFTFSMQNVRLRTHLNKIDRCQLGKIDPCPLHFGQDHPKYTNWQRDSIILAPTGSHGHFRLGNWMHRHSKNSKSILVHVSAQRLVAKMLWVSLSQDGMLVV